jgi:3'-5' exonuclease
MLEDIRLEDILFIDIETVPQVPAMNLLDPEMQALWDKKSKHFREDGKSAEDAYERAGIYAEFGKIICISAGYFSAKDPWALRLKSFFGDSEPEILKGFSEMLAKFAKPPKEALLCAHNGKEFDYPYIARRMIVNRLSIPTLLDNAGKKPWDVKLLDTMDLWKFGDYKSYTSLNLLTKILGIPSPKDDIDGSMVAGIYYTENDLPRIVRYCEKDVTAVAQVFLRYRNQPPLIESMIESVTVFTDR